MKNRDDLIRQWRRETDNRAVEAYHFSSLEDVDFIGESNPSQEETFDQLLQDQGIDPEKLDKEELLRRIKLFWDMRNEGIVDLENAVESANHDLEYLEGFLEYVKWLEEKLA